MVDINPPRNHTVQMDLSLGRDDYHGTHASVMVDGICRKAHYENNTAGLFVGMSAFGRHSDHGPRFFQLCDQTNRAHLMWAIWPWNMDQRIIQTSINLAPELNAWSLELQGKARMRLETAHSRNLEPAETGVNLLTSGSWRRVSTGPTHMLWIIHPADDGPLSRFKDIGTGEDGGIKFRFRRYGYVLYAMQADIQTQLPWTDVVRSLTDIVVMRYVRRELDVLWAIGAEGVNKYG
jgi:hypothetical protein